MKLIKECDNIDHNGMAMMMEMMVMVKVGCDGEGYDGMEIMVNME